MKRTVARRCLAAASAALVIGPTIATTAAAPLGHVKDRNGAWIRLGFDGPALEVLRTHGLDLSQPEVDPNFPWTPGYTPPGEVTPSGRVVVDDRYFTDAARAALWPCINLGYLAAEAESPDAVHALVERCMDATLAQVGSAGVCLDPAREPALCTDLGYHASWCGRRDRPAAIDKSWVCWAPIASAVENDPSPRTELAFPLATSGGSGTVRHYHETDSGVRVFDRDGYFEWDDHVPLDSFEFAQRRGAGPAPSPPLAGVTPATPRPVIHAALPPLGVELDARPAYATTGVAVGTCAEYAVEKYLEFVQLDDWERVRARTSEETFAAIYENAEAGGPFVTAAGDLDFRDRAGARACDATIPGQCDVDGRAGAATGHLITPAWGSNPSTTFQNAYAYARQVLAIDALPNLTRADRFARYAPLQRHYTADARWHKRMRAALSGYHADLLEDLRTAQRAVWSTYVAYEIARDALDNLLASPPCTPGWAPAYPGAVCSTSWKINDARTRLTAARTTLAAAIADEPLLCPATGPLGETPCDWAPSRAVDAVHGRMELLLQDAYNTCVKAEGKGPLVEAQLEAALVHPAFFEPQPRPANDPRYPSTGACPIHASWTPAPLTAAQTSACTAACGLSATATIPAAGLPGPAVAACRALVVAGDPRRTPAALEALWRERPRYLELLTRSLAAYYRDTAYHRAGDFQKTMGNSYFGLTANLADDAGVPDQYAAHVCDRSAYLDGRTNVGVSLLPNTLGAVMEAVDRVSEYNRDAADGVGLSELSTQVRPDAHGWRSGWACGGSGSGACPDVATLPTEPVSAVERLRVGGNLVFTDDQTTVDVHGALPTVEMATPPLALPLYLQSGPFGLVLRIGADGAIGATGAWNARVAVGHAGAGCTGVDARTTASATGFARLGAFAEGAIYVGVPGLSVDFGLRGRLDLIDASLTLESSTYLRSGRLDDTQQTTRVGFALGASGSGSLFSGSLAVFLELNVLFVPIQLAEIVIASFKGPTIRFAVEGRLGTDGLSGSATADACLMQDLSLFGSSPRMKDDGCPCYPWERTGACAPTPTSAPLPVSR